MNIIVKFLKESSVILFLRIWFQLARKARFDAKYIANSDRYQDWHKLQSDLAIRVHAIEKGMSIGHVKIGFGKPKALAIIKDFYHYLKIGGSKEMVAEWFSVLKKYSLFNKELGGDMKEIDCALDKFSRVTGLNESGLGGIYVKNMTQTLAQLDSSFAEFSQSRFSVRDFGQTKIEREEIIEALKICERTPSACNRQPWSIFVYESEELKNKMFSLQGGCKGFYEDMQYAILVCGDQRNYNINELYQVYVDGGLYGMNLLYALHSKGLATIPLTMGHKFGETQKIKSQMNIPEYDIPVILIGVGSYKKEYKVAASIRKNFSEYVKFDNK